MTTKTTQTIKFSDEDVRQALCEYLLKINVTCKPEDISLDIETRIEGYGISEYTVPYLEASATVDLEIKTK